MTKHRTPFDAPWARTKGLSGSFVTTARHCALAGICALLAGCATAALQAATGKVAEVALNALGVQVVESRRAPKTVSVRLEGAQDLNAGSDGQGLSTVLRLYKLRDHNSFLALPYNGFGSPEKEKQAMGNDLIEVRELILSPGQTLDIREQVNTDVAYIGVVALFRTPYPQRWRFAFATADADKSRITIGVHACAMTSPNTAPIGFTADETALLTPVKCKRNLL